jgi:hypothetical protein
VDLGHWEEAACAHMRQVVVVMVVVVHDRELLLDGRGTALALGQLLRRCLQGKGLQTAVVYEIT